MDQNEIMLDYIRERYPQIHEEAESYYMNLGDSVDKKIAKEIIALDDFVVEKPLLDLFKEYLNKKD